MHIKTYLWRKITLMRMKKLLLSLWVVSQSLTLAAQDFDAFFEDKTLRIDYVFNGNAEKQLVSIDGLASLPGWAGRRTRLSELPVEGNGQVILRDNATKQVIYKTSFSTLFQEWIATDEAQVLTKGFENTFLVPFPKQPTEVEVVLFGYDRKVQTQFTHLVNPDDILIQQKGLSHITPYRYIYQAGSPEKCIDVAILAEGYTAKEMDTFYQDAAIAVESMFNHEPFKLMKDRFNFVAVASESLDSGVSIPRLNDWKRTAFSSHFSTFYSDRYLTTTRMKTIHDVLAGIPYEHIIVLANTEEYGGGGVYNSLTLTAAHHPDFKPVVVHEFGHSFGALGDEYFYDQDVMTDTYPLDVEPWEPNITTLVDFDSKWKHLIKPGTPTPTNPDDEAKYAVGLYEGGGYSKKGIYRGSFNCRMRTNHYPTFCPVCEEALRKMIDFYTE